MKEKRPEPLTPREVKAARLLPYQTLVRWGYDRSALADFESLPEQVKHEFKAAQAAYKESEQRGTFREDYPHAFEFRGPHDDLVAVDGLMVHEWQL